MGKENKKGCVGGFLFLIAGMFFFLSFICKQGSNSSKGSRMSHYINGQLVSNGTIGGNSKAVEVFDIFFWAAIILGIIMIILGIVCLCSKGTNKTDSSSSTEECSTIFIKCPNCGEKNGSNNEYCFKCKTLLHSSTPPIQSNHWVCPNCGRENENYVGTCGCGEVKSK